MHNYKSNVKLDGKQKVKRMLKVGSFLRRSETNKEKVCQLVSNSCYLVCPPSLPSGLPSRRVWYGQWDRLDGLSLLLQQRSVLPRLRELLLPPPAPDWPDDLGRHESQHLRQPQCDEGLFISWPQPPASLSSSVLLTGSHLDCDWQVKSAHWRSESGQTLQDKLQSLYWDNTGDLASLVMLTKLSLYHLTAILDISV